jgi:hypothetical protein
MMISFLGLVPFFWIFVSHDQHDSHPKGVFLPPRVRWNSPHGNNAADSAAAAAAAVDDDDVIDQSVLDRINQGIYLDPP